MGMRIKKRRKSRRFRGSHTHGRGFKKKARGSGHRGGVGMAGTGKRGDQRKSMILKNTFEEKYFGKRATRLRFGKPKLKELNLARASETFKKFISKGLAKENKGVYELTIKNYKIIGELPTPLKLKIHAGAASESAVASVKKHGGEIILPVKEHADKVAVENKDVKVQIFGKKK